MQKAERNRQTPREREREREILPRYAGNARRTTNRRKRFSITFCSPRSPPRFPVPVRPLFTFSHLLLFTFQCLSPTVYTTASHLLFIFSILVSFHPKGRERERGNATQFYLRLLPQTFLLIVPCNSREQRGEQGRALVCDKSLQDTGERKWSRTPVVRHSALQLGQYSGRGSNVCTYISRDTRVILQGS